MGVCSSTEEGGLLVYLGHVLRIRNHKHPWRGLLVDGHDVPADTEEGTLGKIQHLDSYFPDLTTNFLSTTGSRNASFLNSVLTLKLFPQIVAFNIKKQNYFINTKTNNAISSSKIDCERFLLCSEMISCSGLCYTGPCNRGLCCTGLCYTGPCCRGSED